METAVKNRISGIDADCGGACACATCHIYVEEPWGKITGAPSEMEEDMLDFAYDIRDNSRLSCQLKITEELDVDDFHHRLNCIPVLQTMARTINEGWS